MRKRQRPPPNDTIKPPTEDEARAESDSPVDEPKSDDELFALRVCLINEILYQMDPWDQGSALAMLVGEHLGTMVKPGSRKAIRDKIVKLIDEGTAGAIARMKAEKLPASLEKKIALMADVSTLLN